jgi:4-hydroxybutyryl-CoA dehydratase/vinylacetyl-CoA-Delta-isomerase
MAFRTPEEALEALRDGRQIYSGGELIDDVTTHPRTRDRAMSHASAFTAFTDSRKEIFVMEDPETGEEVDRFMVPPTNSDDLLARARAIDFGMRYGGPSFGSDSILSLRWVAPELEKYNPMYRENIENAFKRARDGNLTMSIVMSDTKGDRSKHPSEQGDPDLYVRKVDENADGIIIRGMKAHISGATFSDELIVLPTKRMRDTEPEYSIACMVEPKTPGVRIIERMDYMHESEFDHPLAPGGVGGECFVWFDDVLVPWDRVFQNGENEVAGPIAYALGLWQRYSAMCYKKPTLEMLAGAAALSAEYLGIEKVPHIQDKLFEFAMTASAIDAFIQAAAVSCETRDGVAIPNESITNVGKYTFASKYHELVKNLLDISGAIVITAPSEADFRNEDLHGAFKKYLSSGNADDAEDRMRLWNLIRDLGADAKGGHKAVLALHAEGSLAAQKMMTMRGYDFDHAKQYVKELAGISPPEGAYKPIPPTL